MMPILLAVDENIGVQRYRFFMIYASFLMFFLWISSFIMQILYYILRMSAIFIIFAPKLTKNNSHEDSIFRCSWRSDR